MLDLKANPKTGVEFMAQFRSRGPWMLLAINPMSDKECKANNIRKILCRSFDTNEAEQAASWIEEQNGDRNIYFSVNPTIEKMHKKAERTDIASMEYIHVDLDPRAGEDIDAERERIMQKLRDYRPIPTFVTFSGGGYQAFWKIQPQIIIGGEVAAYEDAKRYNIQMELVLGGDNCHNVDRIMRLPGTVNWPDDRKKKKGRVPVMSEVVFAEPTRIYPREDFTAAQPVSGASSKGFSGGNTGLTPQINTDNIKRLEEVHDLDTLTEIDPKTGEHRTVNMNTKQIIVQGRDPDNPLKWGESRSEWLYHVCCELVRAGVPDEVIYAVITDPDFKISESVIEKASSMERYALRQIERAKEECSDGGSPELRELNERHAVISSIGGKCRILSEQWDEAFDRLKVVRQGFEDFRNRYCNRHVVIGVKKDGTDVTTPLGKWWITHPHRRQFDTIVFAPGREVSNAYNLWKGFACEARPGSADLFLTHVKENICCNNEEHYDYLMGWLANAVQNPGSPGQTAVVLRGRQGTGKGVFAKTIGYLFGRHFMQVTNSKHLVGNFNYHLRDCVLLFADEAFYAGDKQGQSILKGLVTENQITIESKGVDAEAAPNYLHVIMASNSDWVVPADLDDRRFFMIDVSDRRKEDGEYFCAIEDELGSGGYEALLHHLMTYDLTDFNLRNAPKTEALAEQKEYSLRSDEAWWYDKLHEGRVFLRHEDWQEVINKEELLTDFRLFMRDCKGNYRAPTMHAITKLLGRVLPVGYPALRRQRVLPCAADPGGDGAAFNTKPYFFVLPSMDECRKHWESVMNCKVAWQDAEDVTEKPAF